MQRTDRLLPPPNALPAGSSQRAALRAEFASLSLKHLVLSVLCFLLLLPFVWMVLTSLKPLAEVGLESWLPTEAQWSNYLTVFQQGRLSRNSTDVRFGLFYWNSIFVASWATFLQVLTSAMAAFAFTRLTWPGRDKVFLLYLSTMMLPGLVMMIPNYQLMINLHLVDSLAGLIIPSGVTAFGTFLLRQFMLGIPRSLDEAAAIDGAGRWRVFWDVILPLSRPALVTLAILSFVGNYQSFFWPLVMLKSTENYTLPVGLLYFDSSAGQATHLLMAAVTMSVVPMIVLFVLMQKYVVKGIQLGAVKE